MTFIKYSLYALLAVAFIVGAVKWSAYRDRQLSDDYAKYVTCVKAQYNTTPEAYYAENGKAPDCE